MRRVGSTWWARSRPAASLTPAQTQELQVVAKLSLTGFFLHTATQLVHINCPWPERWQRLLSCVLAAAGWAWPKLAPHNYLRWRHWINACIRVTFYMFPLLRKPRGIQRVLDSPASPGAVGFLIDALKVTWGARLVAVAMCALAPPLPLLPHIVIQLYSVYMVLNNKTLCSTRLLVENRGRVREFHRRMGALAALTPAGGGVVDDLVAADDAAACSTFISFIALVVCLVLPTAIVCATRMLVGLPGWGRAVDSSQRWAAVVVRGMCGVRAEGERKTPALVRGVQWWFLIHLAWVIAGLKLPGAL